MDNILQGDVLSHLQDVELMILKDFVKICEENNIEYYLIFGTQIGAIRHQGFIPWDDDIDIMIFREDYERFLKVMEEHPNDKYTIFDPRYDKEYCFEFGRMSLNGTYWAEYWDNQVSFKMGIHIDLFILDVLPDNKIKRWLFIQYCFIVTRLHAISLLRFDNYPKIINLILNFIHALLNFIKLNPTYFQKRIPKLFRKYEKSDSGQFVTDLTLHERVVFKRNDYKPPKRAKFEDSFFYIPNDDDNTLIPIYGDYMKHPTEEEQFCHILNEIDFGKY